MLVLYIERHILRGAAGPGGGGCTQPGKGRAQGPTTGERWLSRPAAAKKGGLSLYYIVGYGCSTSQFN